MANQKKISLVASLKDKLAKAKGVVLADYSGLTHKQTEELRAKLKAVSGEFLVVKNSLFKLASSTTAYNLTENNPSLVTGPTAVILAYDDILLPLKELYKFIKAYSLPKVRLGRLENLDYSTEKLAALAALPSKETLISQLLYTLNANTQKLAYLLDQIKNKKAEN